MEKHHKRLFQEFAFGGAGARAGSFIRNASSCTNEDICDHKAEAGMEGKGETEVAEKKKRLKIKAAKDEKRKVWVREFIAPAPAKYRERFKSTCHSCFESNKHCDHFKERRLKLLLIGHNPSEHAWRSGFFYSNPSNRMWKLLTGEPLGKGCEPYKGVVPKGWDISKQNLIPGELGIGFTDIGTFPGSDAAKFVPSVMKKSSRSLIERLKAHMERVERDCASDDETFVSPYPHIVAFTGKRQFQMMFQDPKRCGKVNIGARESWETLPLHWPFPRDRTVVWILPSSSGRAAMTHAQRYLPYQQLAQAFHSLETDNGPPQPSAYIQTTSGTSDHVSTK